MLKRTNQAEHRGRRWPRWVKRAVIGVSVALAVAVVLATVVAFNTQLLVGAFQGYRNPNSFQARAETTSQLRADGTTYVNDLEYAATYPNSFLDVTYSADADSKTPTIVFFHGGGFFAGDKVLGDPLAVDSDVNYLYDRIVREGYNFVNVNYALVPDARFPVPVLQMNDALGYLRSNATELRLNMDNVIIMGSSAGAIMTAQYGAILSNPDYAAKYGMEPSIPLRSVRGLIIDDAPLDINHFEVDTMILVGNYIGGNIFPSAAQRDEYDPTPYVTTAFPPSLLLGSNYDGDGYAHDMARLAQKLESAGVEHDNFYERRVDGSEAKHGLLGGLQQGDTIAIHAFERLVDFLGRSASVSDQSAAPTG